MVSKKRRLKFFLLGFLIFIVIIILVLSCPSALNKTVIDVQINQQTIKAEVVRTPSQLYQGLSKRTSLCSDCGMLFVFSDFDERTFVMREMLFPLDIIFIAKGKVVKIYENLAPEGDKPQNLYNSEVPADQVLEINAGQAEAWGIKVGDELTMWQYE
jgi:hypothetical protein